ncbi:MAG: LytTR family transcriptional regulator DNA-binding domain-containing protein [Lachnospiraceae bacterium]|jgi:DNA-binding LytR/AlgR family response regulator|nr:LytTR family transcriptional regulator DNA-binding domain-containing protein [Lachnospiraceae bacterium]
MLKVYICDNDKDARSKLKANLEKFVEKLKINILIREFDSSIELLNTYDSKDSCHMLYLDTDLKQMDGIKTAELLRKAGYNNEIIYYSCNKPEVFRSFDVDAFHYIIKNETSIEREKEIFFHGYEAIKRKSRNYITVSCGGESVTLPLREIRYFTVNKRIVKVVYGKEKIFEFYSSLNRIASSVEDKGFIRINKNCLLNMRYIRSKTKTDVIGADGKTFEIGRNFRKEVPYILDEYFKEKEVLHI